MIFIKFLKQQNWWYVVPCVIFLWLFQSTYHGVGWSLFFATAFLICYSLKFAEKQGNLFIDQLKLVFYFLCFTTVFIYSDSWDMHRTIVMSFPVVGFYLYFYTLLLYYKREMENQGKIVKRAFWLPILLIQSFFMIGIGIWATTQKVEADKQKELAKMETRKAIEAKQEAEKYQELYEKEKLKTIIP
jgi:hypothetical protein